MYVFVCVDVTLEEKDTLFLSIKMPALCFHAVESRRAGPVAEDVALNRRP